MCRAYLQDINSPESAELSSIVVSGVSDITAFRCVLNQTIHMHRRVLFAWCLLLIYLYRWLIQIESQCQSTASVNSANGGCQATNVAFTCADSSAYVEYELVLRWLENPVSIVYFVRGSGDFELSIFRDVESICRPLVMLTDILVWFDVRILDVRC